MDCYLTKYFPFLFEAGTIPSPPPFVVLNPTQIPQHLTERSLWNAVENVSSSCPNKLRTQVGELKEIRSPLGRASTWASEAQTVACALPTSVNEGREHVSDSLLGAEKGLDTRQLWRGWQFENLSAGGIHASSCRGRIGFRRWKLLEEAPSYREK